MPATRSRETVRRRRRPPAADPDITFVTSSTVRGYLRACPDNRTPPVLVARSRRGRSWGGGGNPPFKSGPSPFASMGADRGSERAGPGAPLDRRVLDELAEGGGHVAFNGLRRSLGAHPESLTRSLRRLERVGEVRRDRNGYTLAAGARIDGRRPRRVALASVRLPAELPPEAVLGALAGRWFGGIRWRGTYDAPPPPALVWSVEGSEGQLVLRLRGSRLSLEAELPASQPLSPSLAAAGELLLWNALGRLRASFPTEPPRPDRSWPRRAELARVDAPRSSGWAS